MVLHSQMSHPITCWLRIHILSQVGFEEMLLIAMLHIGSSLKMIQYMVPREIGVRLFLKIVKCMKSKWTA